MDFVSLWRQTTGSGDGKEAGVNGSERNEVVDRREELQVQYARFNTVDLRTQEVPTKLNIVIAHKFVNVRRQRRMLLVKRRTRHRIAETVR